MPQIYNLTGGPIPGVNPAIVSLRYWLWPSVTDRSVELTVAQASQAHYVEFEGYDKRNATGNLVAPLNHIDTWPRSCLDVFAVTGIEDLLRSAFPAPTAD